MNDSVKFQRLQDLASDLQSKLQSLGQGQLNSDELHAMTEQSRELYERLVVLRFKAFAEEVTPSPIAAKLEKVEAEMPAIAFKIEEPKSDVLPNQVSLIDAIEEVEQQIQQEEIIEEAPESLEEVREDVIAETQLEEEVVGEKAVLSFFNEGQQVNDRLSSFGAKETLAQRMEHNPIPDLKKAITLNQRFQFSKELFKGNNQDYEVAIDRLNTSGREEALKHLDTLRSKYSWNAESSVATDFITLVERRHLG